MLIERFVIIMACSLGFIGGMISMIPIVQGKRLWLSFIGFAIGIASYLWLSKYFIG